MHGISLLMIPKSNYHLFLTLPSLWVPSKINPGKILYHSRAVNDPFLSVLNSIGMGQSVGREATASIATQLLDDRVIYPNLVLRFGASKIVIRIHSGASYLSVCSAKS